MLNLKQLETFVCIAELGSFRQAADVLYTTQPAVSTRIFNLEQTLNTTLFFREGGKVSLTAKGRELLPLAKGIVSASQQLRVRADAGSVLSGLLKIGVSETLVHTWIPDFLEQVHQQLPDVEVELVVDATINLTRELNARNIDIAMMMGPVSDPAAVNQTLSHYPLIWVAHPELDISDTAKLSDFLRWPIITYGRNTSPYHELARYFRQQQMGEARFYSSSSLSASLKLVENGVGIASLPREVILSQLNKGLLKEIKAEWEPAPLHFTITYLDSSESVFNPLIVKKAVELAVDTSHRYQAGTLTGSHLSG